MVVIGAANLKDIHVAVELIGMSSTFIATVVPATALPAVTLNSLTLTVPPKVVDLDCNLIKIASIVVADTIAAPAAKPENVVELLVVPVSCVARAAVQVVD
jgi:hypothetical protein